jgi:hypothetical protein
MWSIVPCLLLTSAALAAGEAPKIVIHVTTSDAVKVAQMIAKDEGYDIKNDRLYYFDLLESQGQPLLRGYTSVGFYINGNIRSTLSISETTGQVIDMNSCEVFDYPDLRSFQERMLRLSKASRKTPQEMADDAGCISPKVLSRPAQTGREVAGTVAR